MKPLASLLLTAAIATFLLLSCSKEEVCVYARDTDDSQTTEPTNDNDTQRRVAPSDDDNKDENSEEQSLTVYFNGKTVHFDRFNAYIDDTENPYLLSLVACCRNQELGINRLPQIQIGLKFDSSADESTKWQVAHFLYSEDSLHFEDLKQVDVRVKTEYMFDMIKTLHFNRFETTPVIVSFEATAVMKSFYENAVLNIPEEKTSRRDLTVKVNNFLFYNAKLR